VRRPDAPEIVYAGTQHGPYRTDDGGAHWRFLPLPDGTSDEEKVVWSLALHPQKPDTVYAGTQGTAVFRSDDGGDNWIRLSVPLPPGAVVMNFPMRVIEVALDPVNPDEIYVALEVGGLVRSVDGGSSWESCNRHLLEFAEQARLKSRILSDTETEGMMDSHALTISPAHSGRPFLANRMGLFRSDDKGMHWNELDIGRFSPLTYARDVRVSRHEPERLYAALSVAAISDAGSLYRSDDFGETWSRFDKGVSIDSTLMIIAESATTPDRVYCASRRGQVFGTEDGGATWTEYDLPDGVQGVYALACA
jgi:photosystem II stability/assembly factor-like uncharacterized protein